MAPHPARRLELAASLWLRPTMAVAAALLLGYVLSNVDVDPQSMLGRAVFHGSAGDARGLLTVVVGTMITVTSLVFALTIVALQIASTQFSPRLLRAFLRDRGTQLVLSTFVGTVAYALAGLHTVGGATRTGGVFVPRLAVSGALGLALVSVGMLVYYIQHVTDSIRIDTIMHRVEQTALGVLHRDHRPLADAGPDVPTDAPTPPPGAFVVPAAGSGYVQEVDGPALAAAARAAGVVVRLIPSVGWFIVASRPMAHVWRPDGDPVDVPAARAMIGAHVRLTRDRHAEHEVGVGLRQLVDIANRAAAPSTQDVYTAVQAVHHLSVVLADAATRSFAPRTWQDLDGTVRVVVPVLTFEQHLDVVCDHVRQGGADRHPRLALALLRMLDVVASCTPAPDRRAAVMRHVRVVVDHATRAIAFPGDVEQVQRTGEALLASADGGLGVGE